MPPAPCVTADADPGMRAASMPSLPRGSGRSSFWINLHIKSYCSSHLYPATPGRGEWVNSLRCRPVGCAPTASSVPSVGARVRLAGVGAAPSPSVCVRRTSNVARRFVKIRFFLSSGSLFCLVSNSPRSRCGGSQAVTPIWDFELTASCPHNPWRGGWLRLFMAPGPILWAHGDIRLGGTGLICATIPARFSCK